jgi:uncharacterized membrane protein
MMGYWDGSTYMTGYSAWVGVLMMIFMVIVIVAIILLVVWAVRRSDRKHLGVPYQASPVSPQNDPACEAARLRFANGEITKEQFEDICSTLKSK